jgi:hypothetical protein
MQLVFASNNKNKIKRNSTSTSIKDRNSEVLKISVVARRSRNLDTIEGMPF